jgi:hypothetical protein
MCRCANEETINHSNYSVIASGAWQSPICRVALPAGDCHVAIAPRNDDVEKQKAVVDFISNGFLILALRHPGFISGISRVQFANFACEVLKQVQHDVF